MKDMYVIECKERESARIERLKRKKERNKKKNEKYVCRVSVSIQHRARLS
jgi:hypothetical protein